MVTCLSIIIRIQIPLLVSAKALSEGFSPISIHLELETDAVGCVLRRGGGELAGRNGSGMTPSISTQSVASRSLPNFKFEA